MRSPADVAALTSWHHDWSGLRVAVLGLGSTGFSVADTLNELGAELVVLASRADPEYAHLLGVIGVRLELGSLEEQLAAFGPELVIVSPGFRPGHPLVKWAADHGVPIWGDIELAWRLRDKVVGRVAGSAGAPAEWLAVTGTNGKTTTVQLATAMLIQAGKRVIACGNVGVPVLDAIRDPIGWDVLVVELSSFQLHYLDSLSAWASVCLNIADDHLDWHGSAEAYAAAKAKVYENSRMACIYNLEDQTTLGMVENAEVVDGCRAIGFGRGVPGPSDIGVVDEFVVDRAFHDDRHTVALEITTLHELADSGLSSPHMLANVLAATALARAAGAEPSHVRDALATFRLDHHRTEEVGRGGGIRWVNDSKATNPHAAQAALSSFPSVVWVVGGLLKGVDVAELIAANVSRLRGAVVIGLDRQPLVEAFARHAPGVPLYEVDSAETEQVMPTVVRLSAAVARDGDTVLLAPAAASMDQFIDYADRGDRFTRAVRDMLGVTTDDHESPSNPHDQTDD